MLSTSTERKGMRKKTNNRELNKGINWQGAGGGGGEGGGRARMICLFGAKVIFCGEEWEKESKESIGHNKHTKCLHKKWKYLAGKSGLNRNKERVKV